jgi:hypothetical protein
LNKINLTTHADLPVSAGGGNGGDGARNPVQTFSVGALDPPTGGVAHCPHSTT